MHFGPRAYTFSFILQLNYFGAAELHWGWWDCRFFAEAFT